MQRRNSSEFAGGSVHGIAGAPSQVRAGPDELDTCLAVLATQNWLSPGDGVFASKIGSCRRDSLKVSM
jgi:hypothetical protein